MTTESWTHQELTSLRGVRLVGTEMKPGVGPLLTSGIPNPTAATLKNDLTRVPQSHHIDPSQPTAFHPLRIPLNQGRIGISSQTHDHQSMGRRPLKRWFSDRPSRPIESCEPQCQRQRPRLCKMTWWRMHMRGGRRWWKSLRFGFRMDRGRHGRPRVRPNVPERLVACLLFFLGPSADCMLDCA